MLKIEQQPLVVLHNLQQKKVLNWFQSVLNEENCTNWCRFEYQKFSPIPEGSTSKSPMVFKSFR